MIETAFKIAAGGLFTVLGILWKSSDTRLAKVENDKLDKELFEAKLEPVKQDVSDIKTSNSNILEQIAAINVHLATIARNGNPG